MIRMVNKMAENTKKRIFATRLTLIMLAVSTVVSFIAWLIFQFGIGSEKLGFPAILTLLIGFFFTYSISFIVDVIMKKSVASTFLAFICFYFGLMFLLIALKVKAFVILILGGVFAILALLTPLIFKTNFFVLKFDNAEEVERKTYEERKAEKEEAEKNQAEEEMPTLKTFKD